AATPSSRQRAASPRCPDEVSMMTLASPANSGDWRSCSTRVKPSMSGMLRSVRITAKESLASFKYCKASWGSGGLGFRHFLACAKVSREVKGAALPQSAFHPDSAAHHLHESRGDGQTQPSAAEPACRRAFRL